MIEKTQSFKTSDGQICPSLESAQQHELEIVFASGEGVNAEEALSAAELVMSYAGKVMDILTTTATSRPKARKVNGGTKTRKPKAPAAPQPAGNSDIA